MSSFYSVIRYLPNPVTDECVNIGVVAFGDEGPCFRFVKNFSRARAFSGQDVSFLKDFVSDVQAGNVGALGNPQNWTGERLKALLGKWHNIIQFTPPRASTKPAAPLVQDIASIFLKDLEEETKEQPKGRAYAVELAKTTVYRTLVRRWGKPIASELVKINHPIAGAASVHDFDVAVVNGAAYMATRALSFKVQDDHVLRTEVDAAAFALSDLLDRNKKIDAAIVALPPSGEQEAYSRAQAIAKKKKILMLGVSEFRKWVVECVRRLPDDVGPHAQQRRH
jgi:hypothetical protein